MASSRQIRDEIMTMTITVNSDPAQKAIYELSQKNVELNEKNRELKDSMDQVRATLGKNSAEYKNLAAELLANKKAIADNQEQMEKMRGELDITQMTMSQLKKEAGLLRTNLANMVPGTEPARLMQEQLQRVNARIAEINTGASSTRMTFSELADKFNQYQGIVVAATAAIAGFGLTIQSIIDRNNEMADAMSGVEKTTGMTRQEVEQLTKSFSDFDTRTKRIDLLKIAEVGGRLGVAKSEISDFTREVDKAYVALGDSWQGGVDKLADSMGRIASLYSETKTQPIATSINQIGSALNELAAQGASSEQNISDFVTRMGRTPAALRPPLNTLLGFGSAFEEMGINSEIGASGFSKFLRVAATNVNGFAQIMNKPVEQIKQLINSNPAQFFLEFSEGLKGLDADQVAKVLNKLKLNDNEVQGVLGAAAENADRFRQSVELASKSVADGTSLQNEFNKVNNNAAAVWEKLQKKVAGFFTSEFVAKGLQSLIESFSLFIGINEEAQDQLSGVGRGMLAVSRIVAVLVAGVFGMNAAISTYNLLVKSTIVNEFALNAVRRVQTATTVAANSVQAIYNGLVGSGQYWLGKLVGAIGAATGAQRLQTTATNLATASQQRLNVAIASNPIGLILTLITLAITAWMTYKSVVGETEEKQRSLNDVLSEGVKNAGEEKAALDILYKTATNDKLSREERLKAVQQLQQQYPSYFGNIDKEIIMNGKAETSYYALRDAIVSAARAEAAKDELKKREADRLVWVDEWKKKYGETVKEIIKARQEGDKIINQSRGADGGRGQNVVITAQDRINAQLRLQQDLLAENLNYKKQNIAADKTWLDAIQKNEKKAAPYLADKNPQGNTAASGYIIPDDDEKKKAASKKDADNADKRSQVRHEREMENMQRRGEDAIALARQIELDIEDAKIEAMKDGYDKEIDQLNLQEQRKMAEIDKKKVGQTDMDSVQKKIDDSKGEDKVFFTALKTSWENNNAELENLKLEQQKVFDNKRLALQYKSEQEFLKQQETSHQSSLGRLHRQMNEELATYDNLAQLKAGLRGRITDREMEKITTYEEGKAALQKIYNREEIQMQITHLEALTKLYEGIDLSVLSEDQRKEILAFIDEARNKVAEFKAAVKGEENTDGKKDFASVKPGTKYDLLGLSQDDWVNMFNNIKEGTNTLDVLRASVTALSNGFAAYYAMVEAQEKRSLQTMTANNDRKKKSLKSQLDAGLINQETYKKEVAKSDEEFERKKAQLEYRAAKRQRDMQLSQAIASTALAVLNAANTQPFMPLGIAMMAVAGVMGAIQIATIANTPLPSASGYEMGYNTMGEEYPITRSQDGRRFTVRQRRLSSGLVNRPTHFIAGENGVEMVIDQPTWTSYPPELKSAIYTANARAKGFEGGYNMVTPANPSTGNDDTMRLLIKTLDENRAVMQDLKDYGVQAYIAKTARNGKEAHEMIEEYKTLDKKNQH